MGLSLYHGSRPSGTVSPILDPLDSDRSRIGDTVPDMSFITYLCINITLLRTGGGTYDTVLHTVRGVGVEGIRMLTLDTKTSLYTEDHRLQVPMVLDHDYIPHTYNSHTYHIHTKLWGHQNHTILILFPEQTHMSHNRCVTPTGLLFFRRNFS